MARICDYPLSPINCVLFSFFANCPSAVPVLQAMGFVESQDKLKWQFPADDWPHQRPLFEAALKLMQEVRSYYNSFPCVLLCEWRLFRLIDAYRHSHGWLAGVRMLPRHCGISQPF